MGIVLILPIEECDLLHCSEARGVGVGNEGWRDGRNGNNERNGRKGVGSCFRAGRRVAAESRDYRAAKTNPDPFSCATATASAEARRKRNRNFATDLTDMTDSFLGIFRRSGFCLEFFFSFLG